MKLNSTIGFVLLGVAMMAAIIVYAVIKGNAPSIYDDFAQCITDKGGQMYGAYWCHNCANTKKRFGNAFDNINYIECSSPGSNTFDLCPEIDAVPKWVREDGESLVGDVPFLNLSEFYECELPQ